MQLILMITIAMSTSFPAIGGVHALVVCLSNDGHVAIESPHEAPACAEVCDEPVTDDDTDRSVSATATDCHACVDIALGLNDLRVRRARPAPQRVMSEISHLSVITAWGVACPVPSRGWPGLHRLALDSAHKSAAQRALHSAILRV